MVCRRYIDVCNCDMFSVVNVYLDHFTFCVVCINCCCKPSNRYGKNGVTPIVLMVDGMHVVVNVMLSLMSVMSLPPALCNLSECTIVKLCTLGVWL